MPTHWIITPITIIDLKPGDQVMDPDEGLITLDQPFKKFHVELRDGLHARVETRARTPDAKWALVQVMTYNAPSESAILNNPNADRIFGTDAEPEWDWMGQTLKNRSFRVKGWNQGRLNQFKNLLSNRGIADPGFTLDTPLDIVIAWVVEQFNAGSII